MRERPALTPGPSDNYGRGEKAGRRRGAGPWRVVHIVRGGAFITPHRERDTIDYKLPLSYSCTRGQGGEGRGRITDHSSRITNHQSPITNHQSPITNQERITHGNTSSSWHGGSR
jgi:hypothetical protein